MTANLKVEIGLGDIELQNSLIKAINEASPEGILVVDDKGAIISHNHRFLDVWEINQEYPDGIDTANDAQLLAAVLNSVKNPQAFLERVQALYDSPNLTDHCELELLDGRTVERHSTALRNEAGLYLGRVWFFRDITSHKLIEKKLLVTQFVSDQAPDSILWLNELARICYVNEASCRVYGYSKEELLAMSIHDIDISAQTERWPNHWRRLQHEGNFTFESIHRRNDGTHFPIEISANFIKFEGQEFNVVFARDISERKLIETDLSIAAVAFESQEIMMITDAKGVILRVNQAFVDNTGYTAKEAVGQTPRLLKSGRHDDEFYRAMWDTLARKGTWQGEVWDRRKNGEIYPKWLTISSVKGDGGAITHYVGSHIDIIERKTAEKEIQHLAFYDSLTQLPNRRFLMEQLQHAMACSARNHRKGALLFIDLDDFKTLNDTLGHNVGDLLLQQVAQRLASCVREGDTVARLGGDEFVLILENLSEQAVDTTRQTKTISEKIFATLNESYQLAEHVCRSTPSVGATLFSGHESSMEELLKQADIAMYQAKKMGRNTICFFDLEMQKSVQAQAALEEDLRLAIERCQFQLYYQIQVNSSGKPLGAEVLIRWLHPERGLVSPAQFIPLAEEIGLILPIGLWVLETACVQLAAWADEALSCNLALAVNVSANQFRQAGFVSQVQDVVKRHAINPKLLKLELTESLLLENVEGIIATMNALKSIGVQFSLDDFGTGYSSLQYLKRLPLDQLKIDQSFVRDIAIDNSDKAIVSTIIAMAHGLNLEVIAEGVETDEQRQFLTDEGCTQYQGYLFGKPVPIVQFEAALKLV